MLESFGVKRATNGTVILFSGSAVLVVLAAGAAVDASLRGEGATQAVYATILSAAPSVFGAAAIGTVLLAFLFSFRGRRSPGIALLLGLVLGVAGAWVRSSSAPATPVLRACAIVSGLAAGIVWWWIARIRLAPDPDGMARQSVA